MTHPFHLLRARRAIRHATTACDFVFNVARGVPMQGTLRARLEARRVDRAERLARESSRATPEKS